MISKVDNIIKTLEKKEKIISYLKSIYKVEVGEEPMIPEAYIEQIIIDDKNLDSNLLKNNFIEPNNQDDERVNYFTFHEKVISLRFPSLQDKNHKQKIAKIRKEKEKNPENKNYYQHIYDLDISRYGDKEFSFELLKQICDTMKIFKTLMSIDLSRNNLDDSYSDLLVEIFNFPNIKKVNLSFNLLTKVSTKKIIPLLRSNQNLEYLDFRYNIFCLDETVCSNICNSLRNNHMLVYFAICDSSTDSSGMKMLQRKNNNWNTILLEDCKYKTRNYEILRKYLVDKKCTLNRLSLKLNTIEIYAANSIEKGLKFNKSLIYINLNNCGITDLCGSKIIQALEFNKTLIEIDISKNKLGKLFCQNFGKVLKKNNNLAKVDISKNNEIHDNEFQYVIECLVDNQNIISLGNMEESKLGIKLRESVEIILQLNKQFNSNKISLHNNMKEKINQMRSSIDNIDIEKLEREIKEKEKKVDLEKKLDIQKKLEEDKKAREKSRERSPSSSYRKRAANENKFNEQKILTVKKEQDFEINYINNPERTKEEEFDFEELMIKYGVEFHIDEYQDFCYEQS